MAEQAGWMLGPAICEAAGLDANKITALNLRLRGGTATLTVQQVVEVDDGMELVFRRFNLNPVEKVSPQPRELAEVANG